MDDSALVARLPEYLSRQRWFGGKGRAIAACTIEDVVAPALLICRVDYSSGPSETYTLLLPFDSTQALVHLVHGFQSGRAVASREGGRLEYGDLAPAARAALQNGAPAITQLGAEQSNTSARVGSRFIFKLFRRSEAGENPEVEVGRFLSAHTSFRSTAALAGSVTYRSATGEARTVGVLQEWVENSGDGWSHVLRKLRDAPAGDCGVLIEDAVELGRVTAEFHGALQASDHLADFAPRPVTPGDIEEWRTSVVERLARARALIHDRLASWPSATRALAGDVATRLQERGTDALNPPPVEFSAIRIHGDYHLGQTLKTGASFAIIDFEGEPATPLTIRRRKSCALKDVAGMMRSFDYAIETVAEGDVETARQLRATCDLRSAFLSSYLRVSANLGSRALPRDRDTTDRWLRFFEIEKALYELEYEINNRPDWVSIPLRGILAATK